SRRRHTRFSRDWSSDVCSSDLGRGQRGEEADFRGRRIGGKAGDDIEPTDLERTHAFAQHRLDRAFPAVVDADLLVEAGQALEPRSEERRVGKECRSGWWQYEVS